MELSLNEFELLTLIERKQQDKHTQRSLATNLDLSVGTINKIISVLENQKLLEVNENGKYLVTSIAYEILEKYKVKRAVFIAAGFGSRMVPVTLNTPKPLVRVKGVRLIDTLIDAVIDAGIEEIVIVRGYLKEQFDTLLYKYPNIKFIDNPIYNEANNIASLYCAKDMLENAYVLDSDLLLYNKFVIRKYEYQSNYIGTYRERTDDWCFKTDKNIITDMCIGGEKVYHMYGISYWTKEDAFKMSSDVEKVFNAPGGKERYFDEVALRDCKSNYSIVVRTVNDGDIIEIDTFGELKLIDKTYDC